MNWKIYYTDDPARIRAYRSVRELESAGIPSMPASVPGCFQRDLVRNGVEPDLYVSSNILRAQAYEAHHVWYAARFSAEAGDWLHFEGIDTVAEVFLNGSFSFASRNMFVPQTAPTALLQGENEAVVHIFPAVSAGTAREDLPAYCHASPYNWESLSVRKAPHMYGWDILPRIVTSGLWKPVSVVKPAACRPADLHIFTESIGPDGALLSASARVEADAASLCRRAMLEIFDGGQAVAQTEMRLTPVAGGAPFCAEAAARVEIAQPKLWWPKNYGEPHLYRAALRFEGERGETTAALETDFGVRTVSLAFSAKASPEHPEGDFCFLVNGRRVFLNGTNWVPLDAMHTEDLARTERAVALLCDLNCNIVRCWGGNVYESDLFYDLCDRNGVLVWQDFAMACGVYPRDAAFCEDLRREAEYTVKRLRNHPSVALFAGDNECDLALRDWSGTHGDPGENMLTREVLPKAVRAFAPEIPYLPSSPYVADGADARLPENHLWGPRDYFKSAFYRDSPAVFASETGYFGMPSPASLRAFIAPSLLWPFMDADRNVNDDYLLHSTNMDTKQDSPYAFRMRLLHSQVEVLFQKTETDLSRYCMQSQISQAEAMKYFIERFRVKKPQRTGIIWWNLIDGWPEVSDAVTDYYFRKKLAYHYIRRSQAPLCLLFDEPDGEGLSALHAVNDLQRPVRIEYTGRDLYADPTAPEILSGEAALLPDDNRVLASLRLEPKHFYLIEWRADGGEVQRNHYFTDIRDIDFDRYLAALSALGWDEWEGF